MSIERFTIFVHFFCSCDICKNYFRTNWYLVKHAQTVHKDTVAIRCPACSLLFTTEENLKIHLEVHEKKSFRYFLEPTVCHMTLRFSKAKAQGTINTTLNIHYPFFILLNKTFFFPNLY